jgi:hypothetical protein
MGKNVIETFKMLEVPLESMDYEKHRFLVVLRVQNRDAHRLAKQMIMCIQVIKLLLEN